jgi:predicted TIM-barrel fold metal-dependent hydrolase
MGLLDPSLSPEAAVASINSLHARGYVGVRFNAGAFSEFGGIDSPTGLAAYARCGQLKMAVGLMAFGGLRPHLPGATALLAASPATTLIIDHLGFFRQPATGGLLGDAARNDEAAWREILALSSHPQVHVKVSALFRASAEPPPFSDLAPRLEALLAAYGANRLLWGSDFPYCIRGGQAPTSVGQAYDQAVAVPTFWRAAGLDEPALAMLMGGTAARLFNFAGCEAA